MRARRAYFAMERIYLDPGSGDYRQTPRGASARTPGRSRRRSPRRSRSRGSAALARLRVARCMRASPSSTVAFAPTASTALHPAATSTGTTTNGSPRTCSTGTPSAGARGSRAERPRRSSAPSPDAWDNDPQKVCPGGVQWTDAPGNDDRNTVLDRERSGRRPSSLPPHPPARRTSAGRSGWSAGSSAACAIPTASTATTSTATAVIDRTEWSYNQGSMLEAYRLLYEATGDRADLHAAESIADATLATFQGHWSDEPVAFAAIFFGRLLTLRTSTVARSTSPPRVVRRASLAGSASTALRPGGARPGLRRTRR